MKKVALALIMASCPVRADLWFHIPVETRVQQADLVVTGRIVAERDGPSVTHEDTDLMVSRTRFFPSVAPKVTLADLAVEKCLKGELKGRTIQLVYGDAVERQVGDGGVWLLRWNAKDQAYH